MKLNAVVDWEGDNGKRAMQLFSYFTSFHKFSSFPKLPDVEAEKNAISLLEFLYLVPLLRFYFQLLTTTSQSVFETIYFEDAE